MIGAPMLVCYLDDSGKDRHSPITTLAGYVASESQWSEFEVEVEQFFAQRGVKVLHAVDLRNTDGEFKGWSVISKQAFVADLCRTLSHHCPMGVSMSAAKGSYATRAIESDRKRTVTPYTFCFEVIVDWILRDLRLGKTANEQGVSFVLEQGHQNNKEAEAAYHDVREMHGLQTKLLGIRFAEKQDCRAIQMADLLAYYTRRHGAEMLTMPVDQRPFAQPEDMMRIIAEKPYIRSFVATDFGPEAQGRILPYLPSAS